MKTNIHKNILILHKLGGRPGPPVGQPWARAIINHRHVYQPII